MTAPRIGIESATSTYLDLLRAAAALGVLLSHARIPFFSEHQTWLPSIGHEMVVVFFVLSGFLMSHVTLQPNRNWRSYVIARASRIYSVALPALFVTMFCDHWGRAGDPALYERAARGAGYLIRIALSALFLQQSAWLSSSPGSNVPFWSLAYEVWYYVLLGLWTFIPKASLKWLVCLLAMLVAGPKILMLLPVWLSGFAAYRLTAFREINRAAAWGGYVITVAAVFLILAGVVRPFGDSSPWDAKAPWYFSNGFISDFQLGALVAVNLICARKLLSTKSCPCFLGKTAHFAAARSYSLYAYHMPILYLTAAYVPYSKSSAIHVILVLAAIVAIILILYLFTEARRKWWADWVRIVLSRAFPEKLPSVIGDRT